MSIVFGTMAASLDGYIASSSRDLSWLHDAMLPGEDYGFSETERRAGVYIMGANTYREIVAMGVSGQDRSRTYVVTHQRDLTRLGDHITLYSGDLRKLVKMARSETDRDVCVWGGGNLMTQLIDLGLIDELGIAIIPVLLGDGVPFFGRLTARRSLTLVESKTFRSGIVLLSYRLSDTGFLVEG